MDEGDGMVRSERRVLRVLEDPTNVRFSELLFVAQALGFQVERTRGSHYLLAHDRLAERLVLQDCRGEAKPYQVRQLGGLVRRYNLLRGE